MSGIPLRSGNRSQSISDILKALVNLSHHYGADPEFVLAGGGNTSYKDAEYLYVKASGHILATIEANGFVRIERKKLDGIWQKKYPDDTEKREEEALADLMASRVAGEEKRPSVETLMHGFFPQAYVVHTHPSMANGITCGKGGKDAVARLFPGKAIWIPVVNPGYILANTVRNAMITFKAETGKDCRIVFLENHGIVIAGETPEEVDAVTADVFARLRTEIHRYPDFSPVRADGERAAAVAGRIERLGGAERPVVLFETNTEVLRFLKNQKSFSPVSSSFSPDHIVYYGHEPLYVDATGGTEALFDAVEAGWKDYAARNGQPPRIIAVRGLGYFASGTNARTATNSRLLFLDAIKVACYAESFGGASFMPKDKVDFIRNWEVEKFRSSISAK